MSWLWTAWLVFLVASFAAFEGYALAKNKLTLSRYTYNIAKAWPLLPFVLGLIAGALATHFFWQWCPEAGLGNG